MDVVKKSKNITEIKTEKPIQEDKDKFKIYFD